MMDEKEMIKETTQKETAAEPVVEENGGITEFLPPVEEEIAPSEKREGGLKIHYRLSKKAGLAALNYVDRKHNLLKRIIFTVILLALSVYFLVAEILHPVAGENKLMIALICFGFAAFYWIIAITEKNKRATAIGSMTQEFVITFYEDGIGVGEAPTEEFFAYDKHLFAEDQRDCFLISVADQKLFCLEKYKMTEEEIFGVRERLCQKLPAKQMKIAKDATLPARAMSGEVTLPEENQAE